MNRSKYSISDNDLGIKSLKSTIELPVKPKTSPVLGVNEEEECVESKSSAKSVSS